MGGYIELYKTDHHKIKERLYQKLSDTTLPEVYIAIINKSFGTFQSFVAENSGSIFYYKVSYESLIKKLRQGNFTLEHNEFTSIIDWFVWYYQDDHQGDENIFAEHGLISIGSFTTRYEVPIFFSLTDNGIRNFYLPLQNPADFKWYTDSSDLTSQKIHLMINYLAALCYTIAVYKEDSCQYDIKTDFGLSDFENNPHLEISVHTHLGAYLQGNEDDFSAMEHLFDWGYEYMPGIILDLKKNMGTYEGPVYQDHND